MSTKTGLAPIALTASEDDIQEIAGTMTSSPWPIPKALNNISIESVPLPQAMQCFTPQNPASMPRSEDDREVHDHSPEFNDLPGSGKHRFESPERR